MGALGQNDRQVTVVEPGCPAILDHRASGEGGDMMIAAAWAWAWAPSGVVVAGIAGFVLRVARKEPPQPPTP